MYVPQSEISLRSNCGQIRSKLPVFAVIRFTHTTIWVCGKCKMFAISWIDINIILNMNIWSAQQNDNSNERTFNHTNLIISYRFGFFLEFNCEIVDFWFSTNQRSVCLTKMPHLRVLRDHKSDLIRVIMFYYTICIIRNLRCTFSRYDSYHLMIWLYRMIRNMRFSLDEKFVYSQVQTLLIVSQIANRDEESAFVLWHLWPRLPRCAVPRIEFWKFSGFNTFLFDWWANENQFLWRLIKPISEFSKPFFE